jgi:hypothetical protein
MGQVGKNRYGRHRTKASYGKLQPTSWLIGGRRGFPKLRASLKFYGIITMNWSFPIINNKKYFQAGPGGGCL